MDIFWHWWQHLPLDMDPVIFRIGSFRLQYYGLMYLVAFGVVYGLAIYRIHHRERWALSKDHLQGLMTAAIIGLILGARLGYVLFYNSSYYLHHPLEIILPFEFAGGVRFTGISGMSYHGGLIGTIVAAWYFIRRQGLHFGTTADFLIPCIPLGYTFGRIGNFINGELWGRVTTSPIGMHFPLSPEPHLLRHPSQLYEAFGEGIVLFLALWLLRNRLKTPGVMFALYLTGYGLIRFIIEFFREPDAHLGFVFFAFSMGQILCLTMMAAGILFAIWAKRKSL